MNEKLIRDLRLGRIALKHDQNPSDKQKLNQILLTAFPEGGTALGNYPIYQLATDGYWQARDSTKLPIVDLPDFF